MPLKRRLVYALPLAAFALLLAAPEVLAQFGLSDAAKGTRIPTNTDLAVTIGRIIRTATGFVGTIFLILMVYAGFLWMTAAGDSKKVDRAKQLIMGAIIGVVVVASAYAITSFVLSAASGNAPTGAAPVEKFSVPVGGNCSQNADCEGTAVCTGGKCTAANFGECVPGKSCTADAECSTNGGCFDGTCSCDAL